MDVSENPLFTQLADALAFDIVINPLGIETARHRIDTRCKDMDIDIRTLPDVPRKRTADNPGPTM